MKRLLTLFITLALILTPLTGCGKLIENAAPAPSAGTEADQDPAPEDKLQAAEEQASPTGQSPIPDKDLFVTRYNAAAEELGALMLPPDQLEPLSWHDGDELKTVEGGFSCSLPTGLFMFDPLYVRITAREDNMSNMTLVYAAAAAAVTDLPADECLKAMTDMVENVEEDTWDNGYEVNLGDAELAGVVFEYEFGRSTQISQLFINPEGLRISNGLSD